MEPARVRVTHRFHWARAVVAALLVGLAGTTGVTAGYFYNAKVNSGGEFSANGRTWVYRSDFHGSLSFLDAEGRPVGGSARLLESPSGAGSVQLAVNGKSYSFDGPGEYPIRDAAGKLIGTAQLRIIEPAQWQRETLDFLARYGIRRAPQTEAEMLAFHHKVAQQEWDGWGTMEEQGGRVVAGPLGILGFDDESGTFWKVRGAAKVTVLGPDGDVRDVGGPSAATEAAMDEPEITVIRNGVPTTVRGFGRHSIRDAQGEALMTLLVERAPRR